MSEPMKDAWNEVTEGFAKLGTVMRDRYRSGTVDAPGDADAGTAAGFERLREAFERLVEAGRDVGQRSVDVLRDADVNAQAKDAARSLNDALSATVDMIGNEVGQWFGHGPATSSTVAGDAPGPDDARTDADPDAMAARIDQQMEDAEGGIEASLLDAPDTERHRHRSTDLTPIGAIGGRTNVSEWKLIGATRDVRRGPASRPTGSANEDGRAPTGEARRASFSPVRDPQVSSSSSKRALTGSVPAEVLEMTV